ncbi:MAG: histidine kinase, partial [Bacteroidota bacterium]
LAGFVADVIGIAFNEGIYTFSKWKENIQEAEQLKKANLQTQFDSLKNQVNPHFLFNSINILSSLIHEDKERAEKFIDEMSRVYRYLLRNNEDELVPLSAELRFIESYGHLLTTRYGNGFEIRVTVDEQFTNHLLPPLTLQLLVENAVKHNAVLKDKPLLVEITTDVNGWLTVKNNLQKKNTPVDSSKIGLNNIREKYLLLGQPEVIIEETPGAFIISLPLIATLKT